VLFRSGTKHVYQNAPDDITPESVEARALKDFSKRVVGLDGGRGTPRDEGSWFGDVGRSFAQGVVGAGSSGPRRGGSGGGHCKGRIKCRGARGRQVQRRACCARRVPCSARGQPPPHKKMFFSLHARGASFCARLRRAAQRCPPAQCAHRLQSWQPSTCCYFCSWRRCSARRRPQ
jgi:hypothetical protein